MNKFDLEIRTLDFSKRIINLCKEIRRTEINRPILNQLLRSATSIGANYREANGAYSKKDFKNKIQICKKEAQETYYWLELLLECAEAKDEIAYLKKESGELILIFGKVTATLAKQISESV